MRVLEAAVFKYVRDNPGVNAQQIAIAFQIPVEPSLGTGATLGAVCAREVLERLAAAGLITRSDKGADVGFTISAWWGPVQRLLGVSLSDLALRQTGSALTVQPIFGVPSSIAQGRSAFVIMPFAVEFEPVYETIQKIVSKCGYTPVRADGRSNAGPSAWIVHEIWSGIFAAQFVIADCSGANPNVSYEIGIAHTLGRPVLLLTQRHDDVPFDLRHLRVISYEPTRSGLLALRGEIKKSLLGESPALSAG